MGYEKLTEEKGDIRMTVVLRKKNQKGGKGSVSSNIPAIPQTVFEYRLVFV
jgi:hypothetical protein